MPYIRAHTQGEQLKAALDSTAMCPEVGLGGGWALFSHLFVQKEDAVLQLTHQEEVFFQFRINACKYYASMNHGKK